MSVVTYETSYNFLRGTPLWINDDSPSIYLECQKRYYLYYHAVYSRVPDFCTQSKVQDRKPSLVVLLGARLCTTLPATN